MKKFIFIILYFTPLFWRGAGGEAYAQNTKIDSLKLLLKKDKEDTNKVNHLNALGWKLKNKNTDTSIFICKEALQLSEKINFKPGIASAYNTIGVIYKNKGDYIKALESYSNALKIRQVYGDYEGMAIQYGNIGVVYDEQGNYPKSLSYYLLALSMAEKIKDKIGITRQLSNIGIVYWEQKDYSKTMDYFSRALKMTENLQEYEGLSLKANILGNIGSVWYSQKEYSKGLDYYNKALELKEKLGDKNEVSNTLTNIGSVYKDLAELAINSDKNKSDSLFKKGLDYYFKALKAKEDLGDKNTIAILFGNIGSLYYAQKKYVQAEKYMNNSLTLSDSIGDIYGVMEMNLNLSDIYKTTNKYELGLIHYKIAMSLKDTLFNEEKNKEITRKEMNFEFEKKEAEAKAEQDKKDAVASADAKRQKIVLLLVSFVLLLVAVVAFIIFRSLRITRRQKTVIEEQKHLVEEKQKEILDSIYYARRIQRSLLPTEKYIAKSLNKLIKN